MRGWKMDKEFKISDAEFEVMKIIWDKSPIRSSQIVKILSHVKDWKPNTILTLVSRLVNKKAVGFTKEGNAYITFQKSPRRNVSRNLVLHLLIASSTVH